VLLTAALGWAAPLLWRLNSHMPGSAADIDVATMVWNVGFVQVAIESRASLLYSDAILIPFGADLRAHTYGLFPALLVYPIAAAFDALTAFNAMLLLTLVLNGWMAYALFRQIGAGAAASTVAATALMLSGPSLDQLRVGRPIFAAIWIICAAMIAAQRLLAKPSLGSLLLVAAALVAAAFTDLQMLLFTVLWLIGLLLWFVARERDLDASRMLALGLAAAFAAVPFLTIFYPAFSADAIPLATPGYQEAVRYSYRWWDYFVPWVLPHAIGGYELALAAVAGMFFLRHDSRIRFWLAGALVLFVLALGPELKFTGMPMPFAVLAWWEPLQQFRTPSRLTIPAAIGLAAVMALVADRWLSRWPARTVVWCAGAAVVLRVVLASLQHPLATQTYPVFDAYRQMAESGEAGSIVEVPFGVRSGLDRIGNGGEALQFYQHIHRRPIMNAMVARLPAEVFAFYRRHPSLFVLAGEHTDATDQEIAMDFDNILDLIGAGFIVIHRGMMNSKQLAEVDHLIALNARATPWVTEGDLTVFRITRPLRPSSSIEKRGGVSRAPVPVHDHDDWRCVLGHDRVHGEPCPVARHHVLLTAVPLAGESPERTRGKHDAAQRYLDTIGQRRDALTLPSTVMGSVSIELWDLSDPERLGSASAATFPVPPLPPGWRAPVSRLGAAGCGGTDPCASLRSISRRESRAGRRFHERPRAACHPLQEFQTVPF